MAAKQKNMMGLRRSTLLLTLLILFGMTLTVVSAAMTIGTSLLRHT